MQSMPFTPYTLLISRPMLVAVRIVVLEGRAR